MHISYAEAGFSIHISRRSNIFASGKSRIDCKLGLYISTTRYLDMECCDSSRKLNFNPILSSYICSIRCQDHSRNGEEYLVSGKKEVREMDFFFYLEDSDVSRSHT
ncbi:hypothetical protein TNCT_179941 [Trichonephila clavata]|uniref:Uncharacterized protein n=1 Tax=Trichonephila clavata TaxID=2740835 RepID=A0A8X6LYY5_TRICU|nr:hypothetical protein TNCT_179941 [Trichonephila clavata]